MTKRIVVDPITRIEGHLRMEADIENGVITDAFSTGTMIRGIEIIVKDRDPRDVWAYVGRVCGVCTSIHSLCSVRAVEDALHIVIPPNAEQVRNLMQSAVTIQDHVTHFYQLQALDWVDVMSALNADPRKAAEVAQSLSEWPKNSIGYFVEIQKKIRTFIETSKFSIFSNGYWGHPAYKLPPEVNLVALAHYLEALEVQKEIVKVQTIFGGKNPHPNFLVGGMACAVNINDPNALNMERLNYVAQIIERTQTFVRQVYLPDVLAILSYYPEWTKIGGGCIIISPMEITLWVTTGNCQPIKVRGVLSSVATYRKSSNSIPGLWTGCWNLSTIRGIPIRKAKMWGFTRRSAKLI